MKKLLTIHGHGRTNREILFTERLSNILVALREQYRTVSLRPTSQGISVYVESYYV